MRRSPVQGLIKLGSISEIVCYVARSNHAKFHAFITKVNDSAIFWTLAAGLKGLFIRVCIALGIAGILEISHFFPTFSYFVAIVKKKLKNASFNFPQILKVSPSQSTTSLIGTNNNKSAVLRILITFDKKSTKTYNKVLKNRCV